MKKHSATISKEQAQGLALSKQGLLKTTFGKGLKGTLKTVDTLGYVQIDTLAVIARAHHHTLWSRIPDYKETYLEQLLENRFVFEYWSHAASYLPISDYRFSLPRKEAYSKGKSHWFEQDKKIKKFVLDRIKAEGPLQSKHFEFKRESPGNWYEWKPAKKALEQLFMEGKLMVAKRQGFQKVYDLTERVLPKDVDTSFPSEKEMADHLIQKALQAHGLVNESEIAYLRSASKTPVNKALKTLLKEGKIKEIKVEGLQKPYYVADKTLYPSAKPNEEKNIHFLSPFDNMVIQRKRLQNLFDFDYMIECYLPEAKRRYGYFTLPVVYGNTFVARFDPKADRASKTFYIKSIHFEKTFKPNTDFNNQFAAKLKEFAAFNGCDKIIIQKENTSWKKNITSLIQTL